jgi:hypothetical protein
MGVFPLENRYNRYDRNNPWYDWIFAVTKA